MLQIPSEINRSLTGPELALLRRFNALRNSEEDGTLMSNLLITASPGDRAAMELDRKVLRWLEQEVGAHIARLNTRVIAGPITVAGVSSESAATAAPGNHNRPLVSMLLQTFALLLDTRRELEQLRAAQAAQAALIAQAGRSPPPAAPPAPLPETP